MIEQPENPDLSKLQEKAQRIAALISGYIHHGLSADEHDELDEWVGDSDENMQLFEELTDERVTQDALDWLADADGPRMLNKLKGQLDFTPRRRFFKMWQIAVAASLVVLIGTSVFLFTRNKNTDKIEQTTLAITEKQDVQPVYNQATLTLDDGSTINLDKAQNGSLAAQGNSKIVKENGQLNYSLTGNVADSKPLQNTVTTRGGIYSLTLSDGTKIWLNSASSITYPAVFTGNERRVAISGEVYLEVAKNKKMPFIVDVKDRNMSVEVLGTHFNVSAYKEQSTIETTLLEGAVKVQSGTNTSFLKPEQQAQLKANGELKLNTNVNVSKITSWKDKMFRYDGNDKLKDIMAEIGRWYDVEIVFEGNQSATGFNCFIDRNIPVSTVLNALEESNNVHFKIEKNKITVLP